MRAGRRVQLVEDLVEAFGAADHEVVQVRGELLGEVIDRELAIDRELVEALGGAAARAVVRSALAVGGPAGAHAMTVVLGDPRSAR